MRRAGLILSAKPAIWLVIPFSFLGGSFWTGYLSQPYVQKNGFSYVLLSPGFYMSALLIALLILDSLFFEPVRDAGYFIMAFRACFAWILFSVVGIYLGFKIRGNKRRESP